MIWLFKINEVFWDNKPKINEHYLIDSNDIDSNITQHGISLYFATANYFILNDCKDKEIYYLQYVGNSNPIKVLVESSDNYYNIIQNYYSKNK
jgi:hypothetical protein